MNRLLALIRREFWENKGAFRTTPLVIGGLYIVFLLMSAMGALQIGLLDPIVMMYRAMATFFAPILDTALGRVGGATEGLGVNGSFLDTLKFAPGVEHRIFVGSFWIGVIFLFFVVMNLWKPRFFCRFVCPLGALLGVMASKSVFRINRIVEKCTDCNLCLLRCEGASDPQAQVRQAECFACMNCIDDCPENALEFTALRQDRKQVLPYPDLSRRKVVFAGALGLIYWYSLEPAHRVIFDGMTREIARRAEALTSQPRP